MRFQTNTAAAGNLRLPVTQRNNARRNSSRLPLMPHRALFVSQCHHFSPVIYFIAIAVFLAPAASAAVAAMPFLLLHLRSPHPPLFFSSSTSTTTSSSSFSVHSLFLSLILYRSFFNPLTRRNRAYEHLLVRNSPLPYHTTQFHSLLTLPERLYYTFLSLSGSPCLSFPFVGLHFAFSFARVASVSSGIST